MLLRNTKIHIGRNNERKVFAFEKRKSGVQGRAKAKADDCAFVTRLKIIYMH